MVSFLYVGGHIVVVSSKCDLARDLKRVKNVSLSINVKVLNMRLIIWFSFFFHLGTNMFHKVHLLLNITDSSVWCQINLNNTDKLVIVCIYKISMTSVLNN